jgi:apolipoprotein N-acyltransferase
LGTTGITTVIDALGRMGPRSRLFQRRVLIYPVRLVRLPSLYTRIGNLFSWICILVVLWALVMLRIRPESGS